MTRHHADIGGRRMSWLQEGQGRPVVLLHAFPFGAEMWRPQLEAVPSGWMLIAPDLPGFGDSRPDPARPDAAAPATSVDDYADAVLALMRHLSIEQAVIGGLSMGGYVTFAIHRKAAQRFSATVLADTRADADTPEARANREKMQAAVREKGAQAAADAMVPKLIGARASDPARAAVVRDIILRNEPQGIIAALEALKGRPDSTPQLAKITCPALVVVGHEDELTPVALSESIARQVPHAELVVIPGAAHLASVDQPDAFNRALWTFLDRLVAEHR
jgi:3-oxoadipate enol-lactonase